VTYVLIIITYVYGGSVPHTQEFSSKETCQVALEALRQATSYSIRYSECLPK
jgi:hypothetical protein